MFNSDVYVWKTYIWETSGHIQMIQKLQSLVARFFVSPSIFAFFFFFFLFFFNLFISYQLNCLAYWSHLEQFLTYQYLINRYLVFNKLNRFFTKFWCINTYYVFYIRFCGIINFSKSNSIFFLFLSLSAFG